MCEMYCWWCSQEIHGEYHIMTLVDTIKSKWGKVNICKRCRTYEYISMKLYDSTPRIRTTDIIEQFLNCNKA